MESLVGTAPRADVWFLLEYQGRWGEKALAESEIPNEVKDHLNVQMKLIPRSRLLLIKQPRQENVRGFAFFAALPTADPPTLYRFQLNDYADLFDYDLVGIAARKPEHDEDISPEPVFVNCTNGLRDQCCALHGVASYRALAELFPGKVWESTHHGGHRFAANLMHLPHGFSYGRLRKENAAGVMQAALAGRITLDHFRGRTTYDEPVQAAEVLLRRELQLEGINSLKVLRAHQIAENRWQVSLEAEGTEHTRIIARHDTGRQVHQSCGGAETSPIVEYKLVARPNA